ncbi:MAG: helix-turn-helix domain-containing protein [Anaerolineae bacterium]|nr:helix-turn-helix domain-containing protein [Anaerolineae bacterium]
MTQSKADLILHPIRMRILVALSGQTFTVKQLAEALPDVPQTSLYRQVNALADAGLINVIEERPVRGVIEKVYNTDTQKSALTVEELATWSKDDHMRAFTAMVTSLIADFSHYLDSTDDPLSKPFGYHKRPVYLNEDDLKAFGQLIASFAQYAPDGRQRFLLSTILMPATDAAEDVTEGDENE